MSKKIDLRGRVFGRLTVKKEAGRRGASVLWECECTCGNVKNIVAHSLKSGNTQSCGCLHKEQLSARSKTHGATIGRKEQPLYKMWCNMHARVYNKERKDYIDYGGRGITICAEWHKYESFRDYMLLLENCPKNAQIPGTRLDRELDRFPNNDGSYEPGNVRWATRIEQVRNKRTNRIVVINGVSMPLAQAAEKYGKAPAGLIGWRLDKGWTMREAFLTPPRPMRLHT